jgi:hypothetical protein
MTDASPVSVAACADIRNARHLSLSRTCVAGCRIMQAPVLTCKLSSCYTGSSHPQVAGTQCGVQCRGQCEACHRPLGSRSLQHQQPQQVNASPPPIVHTSCASSRCSEKRYHLKCIQAVLDFKLPVLSLRLQTQIPTPRIIAIWERFRIGPFAVYFMCSCYSMFLGFARSPVNFHAEDGSGYQFMGDSILKVFPSLPPYAGWHK